MWRHGDKVRVGGKQGQRGTIQQRTRRDGQPYLMVLVAATGCYVWPDRCVVDSDGRWELRCGDCENRFFSEDSYAPLCPNCEPKAFGTAERRSEPDPIRKPRAYLHGTPTPIKAPAPLSAEQQAAEAERRRREEQEWPF
jgi:hypothetical protein